MSSDDLIKLLRKNGWVKASQKGDHVTFKHPTIRALITITHPRKDLTIGVERTALKIAGLK